VVFLYSSVYIPVDSTIDGKVVTGKFDIKPLQELGLAGWEIMQVVPKTLGVALLNATVPVPAFKTYGAGIGGNIVGVHVLLRKQLHRGLSHGAIADLKHFVEAYFS